MKRFLYYNQDSVNSLLAQIEKGLLVNKNLAKEETTSVSETEESSSDVTGDLGAKVMGIGASLQGDLSEKSVDTEITTKLIRNIQEKVLHDYAFERVYEHITANHMINNESPEIGDYILISEVPTFLDFAYFQGLFADNGAVKFSNEQVKQKVSEMRKQFSKGTQMPPEVRIELNALENKTKEDESERKDMAKTIDVIRNTLPYNRFVMTEKMLVPLDDENFRDDPNIVAFKYGGKISILGYVTNIVSEESTPYRNNDFAPLYDAVNQIMINLFKGQDTIYVVHPIALFY